MSEDQVTIYYQQPGGYQQTLTRGLGVVNIGRGKENDLPILESAVSRQHARLHITQSGVMIEDLGSTNGTYLEAKIPAHQPVPLKQDQVLRIAEWKLASIAQAGCRSTDPNPVRPPIYQPIQQYRTQVNRSQEQILIN
jgi:hypothetical protein